MKFVASIWFQGDLRIAFVAQWDRANRDSTIAVKVGNTTRTRQLLYYDTGPIKRIIYPSTTNTLYERYNLTSRNFIASVLDSIAGNLRFRNIDTYNQVGDRSSDSLLLTKPAATTVQGKITWNYDNIRRLTATRYPKTIVSGDSAIYAYDQMGNRASKVSGGATASYSYNWNNNELTSNGGSYSYDNNGNLVQKTLPNQYYYTYTYDFENRLNKAKYTTLGSDSVTYEYDGLGQRRRKVGTSDTTRYTWDGLYPIVEWNNQGKLKQAFIYANGLLLGLIDSTLYTNRRFFVLHDGLGSSVCMANDSARIVRSLIYSDFGQSLVDTSASGTPTLNRLYAEYCWDGSPANFYWMPGRQTYDPSIGRFGQEDIKSDIMEDPSMLNLYVYVLNDPIELLDPTGLAAKIYDCSCPEEQKNICESLKKVRELLVFIDSGDEEEYAFRQKVRDEIAKTGAAGHTGCIGYWPYTWWDKGVDPKSCTGRCVVAHENVHREQCRKYGMVEYLQEKNLIRMEKPAYEAQKNCLEKQLIIQCN